MDYAISPIRRFISRADAPTRHLVGELSARVTGALLTYRDLARSAVAAVAASDPAAAMTVELQIRSLVDEMADSLQTLTEVIPIGTLRETASGRAALAAAACARRWRKRADEALDDRQLREVPALTASLLAGPAQLPHQLAESMSYLLEQLGEECGVIVPACAIRARFARSSSSFAFVDDPDRGEVLLRFSVPDPADDDSTALRDVQSAIRSYETAEWSGDGWDTAITRVELQSALHVHAGPLLELGSRFGQSSRIEALLALPRQFTFADFLHLVPIVRELIDAEVADALRTFMLANTDVFEVDGEPDLL